MSAAMQEPRSRLHLWARWLVEVHKLKVFPLPAKRKDAGKWGITSATNDLDQIDAWWYEMPDANIGVTGCLRIDPDTKAGGLQAWEALVTEYGAPVTFTVRTPRGGLHLYFRTPVAYGNHVGALPKDIDVRGHDSGYTVGPGSFTNAAFDPKGKTGTGPYQLLDVNAPIADAPPWLLEMIGRSAVTQITVPALTSINEQQLADLRDALTNPEVLADWDNWHEYGYALLSLGDLGFELFETYSEMQLALRGCSPGTDDATSWWAAHARSKPRTDFRHIFKIAAELGWKNPIRSPERVLGPIRAVAVPPSAVSTDGGPPQTVPFEEQDFPKNQRGQHLAELPALTFVLGKGQFGKFAYDRFLGILMTAERGTEDWRPLTEQDCRLMRRAFEGIQFAPVSAEKMRDSVNIVAHENGFDSAQTWINSLQWDGVPRVERFLADYCGTSHTDYHRAVNRYVWSALAGRVLDPGCQVDMVVVLKSAQGRKKSTGLAAMAPAPEYFTDSLLLQEAGKPDFSRKMKGKLIVEIAELAGMSKADVNTVKSAITRRYENYRENYERDHVIYPRRCLIFATTNDDECLPQDETGNRRWLVIDDVGRMDALKIAADRNQLWAEAAQLWRDEGICYADAESLASAHLSNHETRDVWETAIATWLRTARVVQAGLPPIPAPETRAVTAAEVLTCAVGMDVEKHNRAAERRVATTLRQLGYVRTREMIDGVRSWYWRKAR